jgi:hypothetical protein
MSRQIHFVASMKSILACVVFFVAGAATAAAQVRDATQPIVQTMGTASIGGRVTIAVNGRPTPMLRVRVTLAGPDGQSQPADTDIDGRYRFEQLPAGTYRLTAEKAGFVPVLTGARRAFDPPAPFELKDAQALTIDVAMLNGAAIEGRVTDGRGLPIPNLIVSATRLVYGRYGPRPTAVKQATSDDLGRFRVHTLPAGDYYVEAALDPRAQPTALPLQGQRPMTLARTYYPGTGRVEDARTITLATGQDFDAADFRVDPIPAVIVAGRVVDSAGNTPSAISVRLQAVGAPPGQVSGFVAPEGIELRATPGMPARRVEFMFERVPPGDYWLLAGAVSTPGAAGEFAAERITVTDQELPTLTIATGKSVTIMGRVEVEGGGSPLPANLQVIATQTDYELPIVAGQVTAPVNVNADGTFMLAGVFGPRLLELAHLPPGWAISHVWIGDVGVTDIPTELTPSSPPTIFITPHLGMVNGEVRDHQDQPLADARVVVFGVDEHKWGVHSRLVKSVLSGPDGRFVLGDLLPGEYLVVAAEYLEEGSWMNPDVLASLRRDAIPLHVAVAQPGVVTLRVR